MCGEYFFIPNIFPIFAKATFRTNIQTIKIKGLYKYGIPTAQDHVSEFFVFIVLNENF